MRWKILFLLCTTCFVKDIAAQNRFDNWMNPVIDSSYVDNYYNDFILRVYSSQKYSIQHIVDWGEKLTLAYRPSNGYNLGVGFTYKFLTINAGFAYPFTTPDPDLYGKCKRLDLQAHVYFKRFYVDFFTGYYKGQYLNNTKELFPNPLPNNGFYIRDDLSTYSVGMGIYTNFNPKKFRFEAPFLQNVKQKKSAGAPVAGYELLWVESQADSSFIPKGMIRNSFFESKDFTRWNVLTVSIAGGYAYDFVILKDFFLLLSLNGSIGIGYNHIYQVNSEQSNRISINKGINHRVGLGYQHDRIFIGASWIGYHLFSPTAISKTLFVWSPGVMRLNIAYRFTLKKGIKLLAGIKNE